jgi:phospholipase C
MPKENAMTQASSAAESRHSPPQESPNPRKTGSAGAPASPIEHVVIIVKENHIFDNYFGRVSGSSPRHRAPRGRPGSVGSAARSACLATP